MNKWIKESIKLVNSPGYLDKLFNIYPISIGNDRQIDGPLLRKIYSSFDQNDNKELVKILLELEKFPIDYPYIASIRKHPHLIEKNPATINRIGNILHSIGIESIIEITKRPKTVSRQLGNVFQTWLKKLKFPYLNCDQFLNCKDVALLAGNDKILGKFAEEELNIKKLVKGLDFILKIKNKYYLGEAKFLTDYGGTQDNQFNLAINVAKIKKENIVGIAVLDGILWFESNGYMYKTIKSFNGFVMSGLLFEDFIKEEIDK